MDWISVDLSTGEWLLFALAGVSSGIINTLAGSGSLITLPIFIFICGLPAPVANGTNRVGVVLQSMVGVASFRKTGLTNFGGTEWLIVPSVLGAIAGSLSAVQLNETIMNYTIGGLMVFMMFVMLINPKQWIRESNPDPAHLRKPLTILTFFVVGFYGGFIQAGVGIFLLAALVLAARYSLAEGNGIKLLLVMCFSVPALFVFFLHEQVEWALGLSMAVFQSIGALIGVRFVSRIPNANLWIHRLLILIVAVSALKFFGAWAWLWGFIG